MIRRILLRLFVRFSSLFGIPELQARLDELSKNVDGTARDVRRVREEMVHQIDAVASHLDRRVVDTSNQVSIVSAQLSTDLTRLHKLIIDSGNHTENRIASLNDALVAYTDAKKSQVEQDLTGLRQEIDARVSELRLALDAQRRSVVSSQSYASAPRRPSEDQRQNTVPTISDELYIALENAFRGDRDVVAQRQTNYLKQLPSSITLEHPLIDLGCGRGEWLDVLRSNGTPAVGVDSNVVAVAECREKGHETFHSDLIDYLDTLDDASVGCITMFQVLEHLPFPVLVETLREARRVLVVGGLFIGEVPNAKNLRVSAGTFWIDPTHQRPLYPELLEFLATQVGFSRVDGLYVNDNSPKFDLDGLPGTEREILKRLLETVDTAGDFALLATA